MKRIVLSIAFIAVTAIALSLFVEAQMQHDQHEKHQHESMKKTENDVVVCPVTNKVMKKSEAPASFTLYFASAEAKEAFLKDPGKYLTTTCPVMGGVSNKLTASYSEYKGYAYHFCCPACKEKFEKEPEKYIEKMSKESEKRDH
jgi:YHS domain-containing protein